MKRPKNKYLKNTHLTEAEIKQIVQYFAMDFTAIQTASLTAIHRNTINRIYKHIRMIIARRCEEHSPLKGEIECDESYFGPSRVKGKRGRGAGSKTIVFGLLKRNGKVYTQIVPDSSKSTLQAIIRGKVDVHSNLYTDGWRAYDGLVDVGYDKHFRVKHSENEFVNQTNHINGIESFWSFTKRRMAKFNGIKKDYFYLFLKESEFRFNNRNNNLFKTVLNLLFTP